MVAVGGGSRRSQPDRRTRRRSIAAHTGSPGRRAVAVVTAPAPPLVAAPAPRAGPRRPRRLHLLPAPTAVRLTTGGRLRRIMSARRSSLRSPRSARRAVVAVRRRRAPRRSARRSSQSTSASSTSPAAASAPTRSSCGVNARSGERVRGEPAARRCRCAPRSTRRAKSDGLVDPALGAQLRAAGYDRTFTLVRDRGDVAGLPRSARPSGPGATSSSTMRTCAVRRPGRSRARPGCDGQGAGPQTWPRCGSRRRLGDGVLVALGGDVAVAGRPPRGRVARSHRRRPCRAARPGRAGRSRSRAAASRPRAQPCAAGRPDQGEAHHILDPRSGPAGGHPVAQRQRRRRELPRREHRCDRSDRPAANGRCRGLAERACRPAWCAMTARSSVVGGWPAEDGAGGVMLAAAVGGTTYWYRDPRAGRRRAAAAHGIGRARRADDRALGRSDRDGRGS